GDSYAYANTSGSAVTAKFIGSRLDLVARTGPEFGYALVTIDDGKNSLYPPRLIDLYSPTNKYQQKVFSTWGLSIATHTVRVQWTGLKNPASSGTYINVDAFPVVDYLTQARQRTEETSHIVRYEPTAWSTWSNPALSGGSYAYTNVPNAASSFSFEGTRFKLYARGGPEFGKMAIYIDNVLVHPGYDLYRISPKYQEMIYESAPLAAGWHTVKLVCTNLKNTFASGYYVNLDAIEIELAAVGPITAYGTVEQHDAHLRYQGVWNTWENAALSGGSYKYSNTDGSDLAVSFTGTRLDLLARKGPEFGIMKVVVDGTREAYVDLYSPTAQFPVNVFSTWNLPSGPHKVVFSWTGLRNPASAGTYIGVDAVQLSATSMAPVAYLHQQNDSGVTYGGSWSAWSNASLSGGSYAYTNTSGAFFSVSDVPSGELNLIVRKGPEFGKARVIVDGTPAAEVDLYSPIALYQQRYVVPLPGGLHTVRVEWMGAKNAASTGTYICLDAYEIVPYP
ncbi:MAG: hypothetical protein Q7U75_04615, partial [Desulfobacterales bacterium]|nr:hypothetical protein [Desulfobacterales bacterium]